MALVMSGTEQAMESPLSSTYDHHITLEDVKKIEQESKDLIHGYVRNIEKLFPGDVSYFTMPTLVIHWILLYYYIWEEFDANACAKCYVLSDDNTIVTSREGRRGSALLKK